MLPYVFYRKNNLSISMVAKECMKDQTIQSSDRYLFPTEQDSRKRGEKIRVK
jgi:hypothetical protein